MFEWKGSGESEEKELVGAGWPMMRVGLGFLGPWISNLCCKKTNAYKNDVRKKIVYIKEKRIYIY